jgi:hypothetical protein
MRLFLNILFLLLTWFTNLVNATPAFTKVVLPNYKFIFSKIENATEESNVKISVQNFARSSIEESYFSYTTLLKENYALEYTLCEGKDKVLNGAGSLWKSFLDDAFTLQKRAEVISQGLPAQFPNLTIDELTAIKVYTSDQLRNGSKIYQTLNTELRAGNLSDFNKGLNDLLNNGLSKLPPHNGNVFRGVYGQEATLAKTWQVGDEIPFKDFKSSSINRQTAAYEFSYNKGENVVYEIIGGKGSNVCGISCIPNEMEVMLKSGQKFKVKEIKNNFNIPVKVAGNLDRL